MAQHWTETVTDSLSLAQAFLFDFNPAKGDKIARERAARFAARCAGGADMFWSALEAYMGKSEVARLRSLKA
jgi:hypothetical protein